MILLLIRTTKYGRGKQMVTKFEIMYNLYENEGSFSFFMIKNKSRPRPTSSNTNNKELHFKNELLQKR